jgi:hypothetical protein
MSTTSSSTAAKLERAVDLFKKCTSLTTSQVMQLAGFSPEECSNLSTQQMVQRKLPGNGKRKFKAIIAQSLMFNSAKKASRIGITVLGGERPAISPLTNGEMLDASSSVLSPEKKVLKNQLNSKQMQDKQARELRAREQYKKSHKAAMLLYDEERSKGSGGMSVRQVAEFFFFMELVLAPQPSTTMSSTSG